MAAMFVAALCFSSCDHNNGEGGNGGGGQEEPATANVIPKALKDIDGNWYNAVRIGDQVWMAENLKTTRYADGKYIPLCDENHNFMCRFYPRNDESYVNSYGYLYDWDAVMYKEESSGANPSGVQGICPDGWHVPSDAEWTQLEIYMRSEPKYWSGGNPDHLAKALAATWGWEICSEQDAPGNNPTSNNASGFSAVPAGYNLGSGSNFFFTDSIALFWSSTERHGKSKDLLYIRSLSLTSPNIVSTIMPSSPGLSVRCVKD